MPSLQKLEDKLKLYNYTLSSVSGRFYAMDRDKIFERNEKAYLTLIGKSNNVIDNIETYIKKQYEQGIYDEFIMPAQLKNGLFEIGRAV